MLMKLTPGIHAKEVQKENEEMLISFMFYSINPVRKKVQQDFLHHNQFNVLSMLIYIQSTLYMYNDHQK